MTGAELKKLREDLGETIGRPLSTADMAKLCGLAPVNGADTIRIWEDGAGPTGTAAALLSVLGYALEGRAIPDPLLVAGGELLDDLMVENPLATAESVFGVMMLAEVIRRLS